tara:strand:+ start:1786 stop:3297 length:1512 start_codon:yes stop_codon:yes gene_type:complete
MGSKQNDIFTKNANSDSYKRYLELLDRFCKESTKAKFNSKFNYFVDEDGNYVKQALDKSNEKENMIILKPKYINIKKRLHELDDFIKNTETKLREYRIKLLNNDKTIQGEFDTLKEKYIQMTQEKDSIINYNKETINREEILKLKLNNIQLNLDQYKLIGVDNNKYLLNNEAINNNLNTMNTIKNIEHKDFIIKEVFNNNLPVKKTFRVKKTGKKQGKKPINLTSALEAKEKDAMKPELEDDESIKTNEEIEIDLEELVSKKSGEDKVDEINLEELVSKKSGEDKLKEIDLEESTSESKDSGGLDAEELNLGDDLEELQSMFKEDGGEDEESIFNTGKKPDTKDEDVNIPLVLNPEEDKAMPEEDKAMPEEDKAMPDKGKSKAKEDSEELDLDKLSRKLNKKVKDPNIKIIRVDPNLQFSNIKCDDKTDKRSKIETTDMAGGKKRRKKDMDKDLKKCIFPFKEGKGKKAVMNEGCSSTGIEDWCATERNEDCSAKKWAYCKPK